MSDDKEWCEALEARADWVGDVEDKLRSIEARLCALEDNLMQLASMAEAEQEDRRRLLGVLDTLPQRVEFAERLQAFFGPMLEGKSPPLNGDDVATRAYVDDSIARLARALRRDQAATPGKQPKTRRQSVGARGKQ